MQLGTLVLMFCRRMQCQHLYLSDIYAHRKSYQELTRATSMHESEQELLLAKSMRNGVLL